MNIRATTTTNAIAMFIRSALLSIYYSQKSFNDVSKGHDIDQATLGTLMLYD